MLSPSRAIVPLPPLPASSSMFSEIGLPSSTIVPATCTVAAPAAAAFAAATICVGVFDATPLPDGEDEPQPASSTIRARERRATPRWGDGRDMVVDCSHAPGRPCKIAHTAAAARRLLSAPAPGQRTQELREEALAEHAQRQQRAEHHHDVDALSTLLGPVVVFEVQPQGELVQGEGRARADKQTA